MAKGDIVSLLRLVADQCHQLSSVEQSSSIEQANTAVEQLDQMTQQNAALVEQSAADSLARQAWLLVEAVGVYGSRTPGLMSG